MVQIFVDHQTLAEVAPQLPSKIQYSDDYLDFLAGVRREVLNLDSDHQQATIMYYFEERTLDEIAAEMGITTRKAAELIRESRDRLKHVLASRMHERWPNRFRKPRVCPICSHPKRDLIEKIIAAKKPKESWAFINTKIKKRCGKSINPPSVLIGHLKNHIMEQNDAR